MEALSFLRLLWRPTPTVATPDETRCSPAKTACGSDDEDDSFFVLELARYVTDSGSEDGTGSSAATFLKSNGLRQTSSAETEARGASCYFSADTPAVSLSPSPAALFSKRKILPMESTPQPQSPISLLKSSPKLRVLMFRRSKSRSLAAQNVKAEETELKSGASRNVFFAVQSREAQPASPATDDASKKQNKNKRTPSPWRGKLAESFSSGDSSSKRLSKDGLQKYLNLVMPLTVGISKRYSDTVKFLSAESPLTLPASSPATAACSSPRMGKGFRVRPKHLLAKSKSATLATTSVTSSPARRDDSHQHDGIQGAILHCKKSYYSSRDGSISMLWRSASDPSSHGKPVDTI
ncbi:membrane-associated kinase regulator 5-like [Rhodamnia argentea]|uniref:Membrane-associated kinase regulator 5-like n=1 Tax=Rhodamnia argentea TaxID=178133 RepID=A0A8B8PED0_9MYRT|nr:membrane-associated kinase regulator 5-like [Rhodamnia argentea]